MRKSIKGEILARLAHGGMSVAELELVMPKYSREQIKNAMGVLRTERRVHIPGQKTGLRNPVYALGAPPDTYRNMTPEEVEERTYRIRMNPHMRPDWRPRSADMAADWLRNPV